jgi:membrane protein
VVSSTRYAAIYASFAILVLFLIWLYVSWLVLLVGAAVAFYVEHPQYLYARPGEPRLSNRMRERLAIAIMRLMADHFVRGHPPWTLHGLTHQLHCPMHSVSVVLDALTDGGVVVRTDADPPSFTPARDLTRVSLADVLDLVRSAGEDSFLNPDSMPRDSDVERVAARIEDAIDQATRDISVASLASPGGAGEQRRRRALQRKE